MTALIPLVRDLVESNFQADFTNDVQLGWYPYDEGNKLAGKFIYTKKAITGYLPSIELMTKFVDGFRFEGNPNRFVVMATYGHGKSHFALTLANFFGQPCDSPLVQQIFTNIAHADQDGPTTRNLLDYKKNRPPHLVVRLFGDRSQGLEQQFMNGLEAALREHPNTADISLPFWMPSAERFLAGLTPDQQTVANQFLQEHDKHGRDVAAMLERVKQRDTTTYELCRQLSAIMTGGTPLDFGGEVSLSDVVEWVVGTCCGEDKAAAGLLILFDEFSAFIHKYVDRGGQGTLQDLLNGVKNCRGRAVFAAFGQHDPDTVALNAFRNNPDDTRQRSLITELNRLEPENRHRLYSSLEMVLDAYLKQPKDAWDAFLEQHPIALDAIGKATDATIQLFPERYDDDTWGTEMVQEHLTIGCFPLHPLTVALLCTVKLREVSSPRSVLGFVKQELARCADDPAIINGKPTWVYPISLVDWFGEMLADESLYLQYTTACQQAGPSIPDIEKAMLKAILLVMTAELRANRGFDRLIGHLTGYPANECKAALESLNSGGYIRYDSRQQSYVFWPASGGGAAVEQKINRKVATMTLDTVMLAKIITQWQHTPRLGEIPVNVTWGHQEDWACEQTLLMGEQLSAETLRSLVPRYKLLPNRGISEAPRGRIIWVLADTDQTVDTLHATADTIISEVLGDDSPPVIVAIPAEPCSELIRQVLRFIAIGELRESNDPDISREALQDSSSRTVTAIDQELKKFKDSVRFKVPAPISAELDAAGSSLSLDMVIKVCYNKTYYFHPAQFFTQYRLASHSNLRKSVGLVAELLATDKLKDKAFSSQEAIANDLVNKFFQAGPPGSWGIMNSAKRICEPQSFLTKKAWALLDQTFPPGSGERSVRDVFLQLMNAPYGYDYNSLTLLFAAWYNMNRRDIQLSANGRQSTLSQVLHQAELSPKSFVDRVCFITTLCVARQKPEDELTVIREYMGQIEANQQFSAADAQKICDRLLVFVEDDRNDADDISRARAAATKLRKHIDDAVIYEAGVRGIQERITLERDVSHLLKVLGNIRQLPTPPSCVRVNAVGGRSLTNELVTKLTTVATDQCIRLEKLSNLEQYGNNDEKLRAMERELNGHPDSVPKELRERVKQARANLETAKDLFNNRLLDEPIISAIKTMNVNTGLSHLQQYKQQIASFTPLNFETKELVERKRSEIDTAISDAMGFLSSLAERIDAVSDSHELQSLYRFILQRKDRYDGTGELKRVEAALDRCLKIIELFTQADTLRRKPLTHPSDADAVCIELDELLANPGVFLSDSHRAVLEKARETICLTLQANRANAIEWLQQCQSEVDAAKTGPEYQSVLQKLNRPHQFLLEEQFTTVDTLREEIQRELDADQVLQITAIFKQITDPHKRQECLLALHEIAEGIADEECATIA